MEYAMVDVTIVKVHRHGQDAKGGYEPSHWSLQRRHDIPFLALTDALSNLVRFVLLPENHYDTIGVAPLIEGVGFNALLGDKSFYANWIVEELAQRGAKIIISQRPKRLSPLNIDEEMYKWRHLIENFFCKLKGHARLLHRQEL